MNFKIMLLLTGISVAVFVVSATISIPLQTASAQISLPVETPSAQSTNAVNSCRSDVQSSDCRSQGFQQGDRNTQDNTIIDATIDINLQ